MEDLENVILLKKDWNYLLELIDNAYKGNTDIGAIVKQMHRIKPIETLVALPYFAVNSWKQEELINDEQIANLKSKVCQATTFLTGLKDTPDSATIGDLRSFIDANYENIVK